MEQLPLPTQPHALWKKYPDQVAALRTLVFSEVFQRAQATLKEAAMPTAVATSGLSDQNAARSHSWLSGYCDAFRDLERLAALQPLQAHTPMDDLAGEEWNQPNTEEDA